MAESSIFRWARISQCKYYVAMEKLEMLSIGSITDSVVTNKVKDSKPEEFICSRGTSIGSGV